MSFKLYKRIFFVVIFHLKAFFCSSGLISNLSKSFSVAEINCSLSAAINFRSVPKVPRFLYENNFAKIKHLDVKFLVTYSCLALLSLSVNFNSL